MRLFTKIFLCGTLVFGLAFSLSGYFLLHYSMESSLAREAEFALQQYQYDKFTVQSALLSSSDIQMTLILMDGISTEERQEFTIQQMFPERGADFPKGGASREDMSFFAFLAEEIALPAAFYAEDGTLLYSRIDGLDPSFLEELSVDAHRYRFQDMPQGESVLVGSMVECDNMDIVGIIQDMTGEAQGGEAADENPNRQDIPGGSQDMPGEGEASDGNPQGQDMPEGSQNMPGESWDIPQEDQDTVEFWTAYPRQTDSFIVLPEDPGEPLVPYRDPQSLQEGDLDGAELWKIETDGILDAEVLEADGAEDAASPKLYFVTQWDISKTVQQQETLRRYFIRFYLIAMMGGMTLLGFWSAFLSRPLKKMSRAAYRMAAGDYEERLTIKGRDEIGELAESFNQMAGAVEEKVEALSQAAREKEDFVANFAHELKTPLTSIIGYADMLYQKELPREKVRDASWYIWNEGMRLEALSLKLMDLIVLGRQDFPLEELAADELLEDVAEGLRPVLAQKQVAFQLRADPAYIRADYDLLKTLLINLMDNAVKAGCSGIELSGCAGAEGYVIQVADDGCGMEEEELSRITEAFYMVDKARSRKQHGAGLGLALAERIARIHGGSLTFQSRRGEGTRVSFRLECEDADGESTNEDDET